MKINLLVCQMISISDTFTTVIIKNYLNPGSCAVHCLSHHHPLDTHTSIVLIFLYLMIVENFGTGCSTEGRQNIPPKTPLDFSGLKICFCTCNLWFHLH